MSSEQVVMVTCPPNCALTISRTVVQEKLAACVNVIRGVTSVYTWNDKVNEDVEDLLVMKTSEFVLDSLISRVKSLHPYDTPEIISMPVQTGYLPYLAWVRSCVEVPSKATREV